MSELKLRPPRETGLLTSFVVTAQKLEALIESKR